MNTTFSKRTGITLLSIILLSSCSRPIAYFQKSSTEVFSASKYSGEISVAPVQPVPTSTGSLVQAHTTFEQIEAYVRADNQLATNQKLSRHMVRVKNLLASTHETLEALTVYTPHKINAVERLMLKKVNKQISRQPASNQPEKVW